MSRVRKRAKPSKPTWGDFQVGDVFVYRRDVITDIMVIVGDSGERFDAMNLVTGVYHEAWLAKTQWTPTGYDVYRDGEWLSTT